MRILTQRRNMQKDQSIVNEHDIFINFILYHMSKSIKLLRINTKKGP